MSSEAQHRLWWTLVICEWYVAIAEQDSTGSYSPPFSPLPTRGSGASSNN
jgi:hypothetical protein